MKQFVFRDKASGQYHSFTTASGEGKQPQHTPMYTQSHNPGNYYMMPLRALSQQIIIVGEWCYTAFLLYVITGSDYQDNELLPSLYYDTVCTNAVDSYFTI